MNEASILQSKINNSYSAFRINSNSTLFGFINSIETDQPSYSNLQEIQITDLQTQTLSGFKSTSFSNTNSYFKFLEKIKMIESMNITSSQFDLSHLFRIMLLTSFLAMNDETGNAMDFKLKLKRINNEDIMQNEIELANKIRNTDKAVDLINGGWIITDITKNITEDIDSIEFSKGTEKILIFPSNLQKSFYSPPTSPRSQKALSPLSPHSNQHSINRQKKQSKRQFDRTDYSNESSNTNDDDDNDSIDKMNVETLFNDKKNSRISLPRTNSEPFIDINPMLIFDNKENNKGNNSKINKDKKNNNFKNDGKSTFKDEIKADIKAPASRRRINSSKRNKPKIFKNNNDYDNEAYSDSYGYSSSYSNSSDFDYSYYSSGDEEMTNNDTNDNNSINKDRNYSTERRRHHHHRHHQISKRIKSKLEMRKLEESPNRTTQLYIDEFDDVRKLQPGHNKLPNLPENSPHTCKNNNLRDIDYDENENSSGDELEVQNVQNLENILSPKGLIKPSHSSPDSIKLTLPYELIDLDGSKGNFTDTNDLNENDNEELANIDDQSMQKNKLNVKLNFNSDSYQKNLPILYNNDIEEEEDEDDFAYEIASNDINNNTDLNEINDDYIDDNDNDDHEEDNLNDNSSSDSNEDFDDLDFEQSKNNSKCKINPKDNKDFPLFEQDEYEGNEKNLPMMSDDIYCSEPFPTSSSNPNDNALLSPNHRKPQRTGKKRQIM